MSNPFIIPETDEEQYFAIKEMMASNLSAKGVVTLPSESLAQMAGKILNIDSPPLPVRTALATNINAKGVSTTANDTLLMLADKVEQIYQPFYIQTGGSLTNVTGTGSVSSAQFTIVPPTSAINWGGTIGTRTPVEADFRLLSAVVRTGWYSSSYSNYTGEVSIHTQTPTMPMTNVWNTWSGNWTYNFLERPYYNSVPNVQFTTRSFTASSGRCVVTTYPYNSSFQYWNASYCYLTLPTWLVKRPMS